MGETRTTVKLHYEDLGSGEPLLLLPGALGTGASDFQEQLPFFSKQYRVIAPDLRGYGQSRPPERDFPRDFYFRDAEDVKALLDELGLQRVSILGWSDGANVAAIVAAQYPERVAKIVVWGGNSYLSEEEMLRFRGMRSIDTWSPRAKVAMEVMYGDAWADTWSDFVDGLEKIYAAGGNIYRDLLGRIECPVLILHGDKDPLVPGFHAEILATEIRHARLERFPEGKHNIHAKYAADFNARVLKFLNETSVVPSA